MTERPILFSGEMVRAILYGRKTQTRRVVKVPSLIADEEGDLSLTSIRWLPDHESGPGFYGWMTEYPEEGSVPLRCPYGQLGDRLWVRETWRADDYYPEETIYHADASAQDARDIKGIIRFRPSIHMPRARSRLTLELTDVRVERVQDITQADAIAEGVELAGLPPCETPTQSYRCLWDSLNAKRGFGWDVNPWVWVLCFKRIA